MAKTYSELLKNPRWQKKRLEILNRDNFTCQLCFSTTKTLHVHHLAYEGTNPWETPDDKLITVCEECHKFVFIRLKKLTKTGGSKIKSFGKMRI